MSNVEPSIDPVPILLDPSERSPVDKSVAAGLVGLVYLARQAFEEKRQKQCLEVTKAILKIEPTHTEARTIQDSVRSDLDREFANAEAVAREARSKNDRVLYERAAAALRRIADADPDNLEAQTLLRETVAAGYFCASTRAGLSSGKVKRRLIVAGSAALVVLVAVLALINGASSQVSAQLAALPGAPTKNAPPVKSGSLDALDLPVLPGSGVQKSLSFPILLEPEPGPNPVSFDADRSVPKTDTVATPSRAPMPRPEPGNVPASSLGALAVVAAVPVEIYRGEEHVGSTPTTLQLPPGNQTLEYRYQGFQQTMTHFIRRQETTTVTISFPIKVQINAKPWAQVFVEGNRLTPIGQTPLGDVSVPIGSVLVFQNPGFPDKRYRVKATDTAILMNFP